MNMKGHLFNMLAMASMFSNVYPTPESNKFRNPYRPPLSPIPFSFKKFRIKKSDNIPKGCKVRKIQLVFTKQNNMVVPAMEYKITVDADIVYGTQKAAMKKIIQYKNEIGYFIYHTTIDNIFKHKDDILIEQIKSL